MTNQSALGLPNNFGPVGNLVVDTAGDAAFNDAQDSAVFLQKVGTATPVRIFQSGDPVPGVAGAHADYVIARTINSSGSVLFTLVYETGGVLANKVLVSDGISLKEIADSAQLATGGIIPGRTTLLNDAGDVTFALNVQGLTTKLYVVPAGSAPVVVATIGSTVPGGQLQSITPAIFTDGTRSTFNNNGELLFSGTVNGNAGLYVASIKNGIRKIAANADQAPGGGVFNDLNLNNAAINNLGQVAFIASVTLNSVTQRGVWISDPNLGITREIASTSTTTPAPGGGTYGAPFAPVQINDEGDVVFPSTIIGNTTTNFAIFRGQVSGAAPQVVAYHGESAPGVTGAGFVTFSQPVSVNSGGAVAFVAQLSSGQNAIYTQSGANTPTLIALDGQASGDGGNFSFFSSRARILGDNSVVFTALETAGSAFAGLFHSGTGSFQKLVNSNDPLPSGARTSMRNGYVSSAGSFVTFFALQTGGPVSAFVVNSLSGAITKIASDGDSVPGISGARLVMPAGVVFGSNIYVNTNGAVALDVNLAATGSKTAVLQWTSADGLTKLIAGGDIDPVTGQTFSLPQTVATSSFDVSQSPINSQGTVLVSTNLIPSGQNAIYMVSAVSAPSKVIATGDTIGALTVTDLTNGGFAAAPQLNSSGQVAMNVTLSDGSQGVYLKSLGAAPVKIVKTGDLLGPNGPAFSTIPGFFSLNSSGEVAFFAGYGVPANGISSAGVFIGTASNPPQGIALDGAPAPSGGNFSIQAGSCVQLCFQNLPNDVLINDEHDVAFSAALTGGGSDSGYFLRRGAQGALQTVALQGQPAPGTNFSFTTFAFPGGDPLDEGSPGFVFALGPNGEVAFQDEIPGQTLEAVAPDLVATFYYGLDNSLRKIIAPGDPAPGTAGQITLTSFGPGLASGVPVLWAATPGSPTTNDAIFLTQAPTLTVIANDAAATYGVTLPVVGFTVIPNVPLDTQPTCAVPPPANGPLQAGTYTIVCTGAAKAGYVITYVSGTLTVNPAVLTVTASNAAKFYGDPVPPLTYTISGLQFVDNGTPVLSTTATAASPVGTYPITVSPGTLPSANYVFNFVNGTLQVYPAPPTPVLGTREFIYANDQVGSSISGYTINATGTLGIIGGPFPVLSAGTNDLTVDPFSRFLYAANVSGSTVSGFTIDPNSGSLAPVPTSPFSFFGFSGASQVGEDPTGQFLYVVQPNQLFHVPIDQPTGILALPNTPALPLPVPNPQKFVIHPSGRFLYFPNWANGAGNTVFGYAIDPAGVPTPLPGSPYPTVPGPFAMAIDPLGRFAYVSQSSSGTMISAFAIDQATGILRPLPGSPFSVAPAPTLLFDGFNIFAVTQQSGGPPTPTTFALTNTLTQITQLATYHFNGGAGATPGTISLRDQNGTVYGPFATQGQNAQGQTQPPFVAWVATLNNVTLPPGTYTVVDSDPSTWSYNTQSNNAGFVRVWGSVITSAQPGQARGLAIDPRGRFLFVTDASKNATWAFTIDQTTGALQTVPGSPYPNGGAALVVEPTGSFLYTSCGAGCGIAGSQINQTSGALTFISTLPSAPNAIVRLVTAFSGTATSVSFVTKPSTVTYGQPVELSASIANPSTGAAVASGTVTFSEAASNFSLGPFPVNSFGLVQIVTSTLPVGVHTITATYTAPTTGVAGPSATATVTVRPAVLTVTPDSKSKVYGEVVPALTFTIAGFVNNDNAATALTGMPALSADVTATTPAGTYPILAAQGTLSSTNYVFSFAVATLTVTAATPPVLPTPPQNQITQGGAPNFADTYITPYATPQAGFITAWQTEFAGGLLGNFPGVPAGVQLKIFRSTSAGMQVVAQGQVHDPRPILGQIPGYPFFTAPSSLTTFTEIPIPVRAGDVIGITIYADPTVKGYFYPLAGPIGTFMVTQNVSLGQSISLASAAQVANPPALSFTFNPASTSNPLTLMNNFFVTGDYAVGSVALRGLGGSNGVASGTINISTSNQNSSNGIPVGADLVGAYLYWQTLESTPTPSGSNGTFRGYSITGQKIGNDLQYQDGNFTGMMRVYRADVLGYLPVVNSVRVGSGAHTVSFPDSGFNGLPLAEGATLVVIYRVMSPNFPLKAVVLYDGSAVPPNGGTLQLVQGFYDAAGLNPQLAATPAKTTNIYTAQGGNWSSSTTVVTPTTGSEYATTLTPGAWAGIVFSTPVNNSDQDGILDRWKSGPSDPTDFHFGQAGYYGVKNGQWIPLPGALHGQKDLFVQMDYMCSNVLADGTCDPAGRSELPTVDAQGNDPFLAMQQFFANRGIALHLQIGNAIQSETCTDNPNANPPQLCEFPGETGVVNWKLGEEIFKVWPKNPVICAAGGDCSPRFPFDAKDSYHYLLMADGLAIPAWNTTWGTLTGITVANGITTITTTDRGTGINMCPSRVTITGALGNPTLNGVYNTTGCADTRTIRLSTPGVPNWTFPNNTLAEPVLGVTSGTISSISGFSDLGGADSVVSLGKWETSPNQDMSKRFNVQTGTILHEIGHTLSLPHGGRYFDTDGSFLATYETNCKTNYQSLMNYLFQLDGVGPNHALDFSGQTLTAINESQAGSITTFADVSGVGPTYPTSSWYTPTQPTGATAATRHCDGTVLTGDTEYRIDGPISPISPAWSNGQDVNFNGQSDNLMRGYNDWAALDLRQIGATSGQFVSVANLLTFANIGSPLNVGAGGSVVMGSGGTVSLGAGGSVTLSSGGSAMLSSGGTIAFGSGGNVTLGSGGTVTLTSAGTITMGGGGNVIFGSAGTFVMGSSGGIITMGGGGTVTLGGAGNVTLGSGGSILLGSGGTVTLGAGGSFALNSSGGTIILGAGGNVIMGASGSVTLGSGGTITLGAGGNIFMGGGGTVAMGAGGNITMGGGGSVILGSGGAIILGSSGGTITLGGGGTITLGGGGTISMGSGGTVTLGGAGDVALNANGKSGTIAMGAGGSVTLGAGGSVTLAQGGNVTMGAGGTISMGAGGTISLGAGGNFTLGSPGTLAMGSGGSVTLGSGGSVTLGSGGLVTLGAGGTVVFGAGGNTVLGAGGSYTGSAGDVITIGAGGNIILGGGGTLALGAGGNTILGSGGTIIFGAGGSVILGSGGNVTLGSGGTITMGGGGSVIFGSGGNITLGGGGTVAMGSGGNIVLGGGGTVTQGSGGTLAMGSGGNTILGSGGSITLGSGGNLVLGGGGTQTLGAGGTFVFGSGGSVVLGSGGTLAMGSGGNTILGSGGTLALGAGGNTTIGSEGGVTLGSGGAQTSSEITYEIANSVARPPNLPTLIQTTVNNNPAVVVNWTPPLFGVVTSYTIYRSDNGGTPVAIGTVTGNPPATTFVDSHPSGASRVTYTISTGVVGDTPGVVLQSPPSVPALLAQTLTFGPLPNTQLNGTVSVKATASSGLTPVNISLTGNCGFAMNAPATSPTTVQAMAVGSCTVTASQGGNSIYAPAMSVSQKFSITATGKSNQTITFPPLGTETLGNPDFTLTAVASSNLPVIYSTANSNICTVNGSTLHITGVGTCSVTASQPGNADYNPAAPMTQSFAILYVSSGLCDGAPGHVILPPINSDGTSVFKQGRTVPVQFRVCDAKGISIGTAGVVTSFTLTGIFNGTLSNVVDTVTATNNDTAFRWDSANQQWIFNLSTTSLSAGKTYIYTIKLNDGTIVNGVTNAPAGTASFQFGLR